MKSKADPRQISAIVMGVSAGGLHALQQILPHLPADFPVPVMIVQHRAADGHGFLADFLNSRCAITVKEAGMNEPLCCGVVYLAPADYHLLVENAETLALSIDPPVHYSRPAIDVLFESAADVFRENLVAVILTGANSDGSQGAIRVKTLGGLVIVQDPATAEVDTMPTATLRAVSVDHILPLEEIGRYLAGLHGSTHEPASS